MFNKNILCSIIIPVYKVEKYLNNCIQSIVNQEYKNLEIILVDDGSPDDCPLICDEWAKKDKRIKVIHKKNGGVSSARNEGLRAATGDYVTFVDGDDLITENFSKIFDYLNNYDVIFFPYYEKKKDLRLKIPKNNFENKTILNLGKLPLKNLAYNSVCVKLFRRELLIENNIVFDTNYKIAEDFKFSIDVIIKAKKSKFIGIPYYVYNINDSSVMTNISYSKILNTLEVCEYLKGILTQRNLYANIKFLKKILSENILSVFRRINDYTKKENESIFLRLKPLKKDIVYGSTFIKKVLVILIRVLGLKISSKLMKIII